MGWFSRILGFERTKSAGDVLNYADLARLWAPVAASGVAVNAESAMRVPAVACAVRAISEAVGQLPVKLYRRAPDGSKTEASDHPAYPLLHDEANDWTSAFDLKRQLTQDALLHGDGLALVNRVRGKVRELVRLAPGTVTIRDAGGGVPVYQVANLAGGVRDLGPADVIHIRGTSLDGLKGRAVIDLARESIAVALLLEQHEAKLLADGGRPSGLLKIAQKLDPEAVKRIASSWREAHGGANSGKTAVLEQGVEFQPLAFNSADMQFLELRKHQVDEIARAFRVPPHLLFELGRATWGNSEEMGRAFLQYTLLPWLDAWQAAIRRAVLTPEERKSGYFAEFVVADFERADTAKQAESLSKLITARVLSPNEARAMLNLPPYAGGDEHLNPNVTTTPASPANGSEGQP